FFFASRRRHTRFSRDWSSDVCSSDLPPMSTEAPAVRVVTDSTACLPAPGDDDAPVVVPLRVVSGEESWREGVDITPEEVAARIEIGRASRRESGESRADVAGVNERS